MLPIRRTEIKKERDREQWSDTFKRKFDLIVNGRGEGLIEGVYFGAAYDTPPLFEFSASRSQNLDVLPEIRQGVWNHPKKIVSEPQEFPSSAPAPLKSGWIMDGGFEVQGPWDSAIPTIDVWAYLNDFENHYMPIWYNIYTNQGSLPSNYPGDLGSYDLSGANSWLQEPKKRHWTVTNEKAHPDTPRGPKGKYSAKYTFESSSDIAPWLAPFPGAGNVGPFGFFQPASNATGHLAVQSHVFPRNYARAPDWYGGGGLHYSWHQNPVVRACEYEAYVFSDQPCTFEVAVYVTDSLSPNLTDDINAPEGSRTDVYEFTHWVLLTQVVKEFEIEPNKWNKLTWSLDVPLTQFPAIPNPSWPNGEPFPTAYGMDTATVNLRAKNGQAGQFVFLDDLDMWYRYELWDDPFITVGVAKWIRDDAGAYVGADVWVKVSNSVPTGGEC